ncbi:phospholipase/carboxylesterase [Xylaria palmicola]|nr:phospholipase/carboxylesterase [Xylaria palmicola]
MDPIENPQRQRNQTSDQPYVVEPTTAHTHTIILLHGLSSNGEKFGKELLETGTTGDGQTLPALLPGARFVFPTARRRRSSAFGRKRLTQWFDIARLADPSYRQEAQIQGLAESAAEIGAILRRETTRVPPARVILGGLSQGCAMSLAVLLGLEFPLGGYIGMCGYLPFQKDLEDELSGEQEFPRGEDDADDPFERSEVGAAVPRDPAVRALSFERDLLGMAPLSNATRDQTAVSTPVFLGHGDADEKKPYVLGEAAARTMRAAGYSVDWRLYPGLGHWYKILEEIDDIVTFISEKAGWQLAEDTTRPAIR